MEEGDLSDDDNKNKKGKRARDSGDSSEDGYITVCRRKQKKLFRSFSAENNINSSETFVDAEESMRVGGEYEVSLSSVQILPKQMALARLIRDQGIMNIIKIKYKSPYKVFVRFSNKIQAEKLANCEKLIEKKIRAQFIDEINLSYGIIRGVDLDIDEKELLENILASCDILSVKRLKRLNRDHVWVDSETLRLSFKSIHPPVYIYAYGCKFTVEKYVFPVTQCSACWKFGHIKKYCSSSKIVCPKCGLDHVNCDIAVFKCPNCKGSHMALDKCCPRFVQEKKIRFIMSDQSVTYKKAFEMYLKNKGDKSVPQSIVKKKPIDLSNVLPSGNRTYSSVVQANVVVHSSSDGQQDMNSSSPILPHKYSVKRKEKSTRTKSSRSENVDSFESIPSFVQSEQFEKMTGEQPTSTKQKKFDLLNLIWNLKNIFISEKTVDEKIQLAFRVICDECKYFLRSMFNSGDVVGQLFNLFNG
ncbi:uncharacterized protein LOC142984784 [Anticarsia gemmatalis]|uniref:uncharacterized protein LOC142984784 n=1 Tax=Anticarsia gemmatalis TaxID=129554 RepID=UPI003F759EDA